MLRHISEESGITRFDPRPSKFTEESVVWAVDERRLRNYLFPRDCPRVAYYAGSETTPDDVDRFLGSSAAVIAIESAWWERARSCRLYCYAFPPDSFELLDECAGYYVSRVPVAPTSVELIEHPLTRLFSYGVELRIIPELWTLRDAVLASTLQFSFIRMSNAGPPLYRDRSY